MTITVCLAGHGTQRLVCSVVSLEGWSFTLVGHTWPCSARTHTWPALSTAVIASESIPSSGMCSVLVTLDLRHPGGLNHAADVVSTELPLSCSVLRWPRVESSQIEHCSLHSALLVTRATIPYIVHYL